MDAIQQNIGRYLKDKNITYKSLAKKTEISASTISSWFTRQSVPNIHDLIKIADFFACSLDYLVGRESEDSVISITYDGEHLSDVEQNLIDLFRQMSGAQQSHLVGYGMGMLMAGA